MSAPLPVHVIEQTDQAAALLTPLRLRILQLLVEPGSSSRLARALDLPRQQVNYHVKALEKAGLLRKVGKHKRGNCIEVMLQATARSFVVGPSALGEVAVDRRPVQDRFSFGALLSLCARTIRELGTLRRGADDAGKTLATLSMDAEVCFESAAARTAFANDLATAFAEIAARHHRPDAEHGRRFRVFVGAHPRLPDDDTPEDS